MIKCNYTPEEVRELYKNSYEITKPGELKSIRYQWHGDKKREGFEYGFISGREVRVLYYFTEADTRDESGNRLSPENYPWDFAHVSSIVFLSENVDGYELIYDVDHSAR